MLGCSLHDLPRFFALVVCRFVLLFALFIVLSCTISFFLDVPMAPMPIDPMPIPTRPRPIQLMPMPIAPMAPMVPMVPMPMVPLLLRDMSRTGEWKQGCRLLKSPRAAGEGSHA